MKKLNYIHINNDKTFNNFQFFNLLYYYRPVNYIKNTCINFFIKLKLYKIINY
jgi:hypothetical protein